MTTQHPAACSDVSSDSNGGIHYCRPDGRAIPRSGYRADDLLDDIAVALPGENPSAEVRMAAIVHAYELDEDACTVSVLNPSAEGSVRAEGCTAAEVREPRGVYRLRTVTR